MLTPVVRFRSVGLVGVGGACFVAGVFVGLLAARAPRERGLTPGSVSLETLSPSAAFTVRTGDATLASFPSGAPCVYFEWTAGEKRADTWEMRFGSTRSDEDITFATDAGSIVVRPGELRLFVAPRQAYRYPRTGGDAPEEIRDLLAVHDPLAVDEYALDSNRSYYARVDHESYQLPPRAGGPPARRQRRVLLISDLPFSDGKPQRPPSPASAAFTR